MKNRLWDRGHSRIWLPSLVGLVALAVAVLTLVPPTVQESLAAGTDVACFSGDKLLGGPQAGIIVGRRDLVERLKRHPLARAVRPDKLCLAGLSATLLHYLKDEAIDEIPIWQMIARRPEELRRLAGRWSRRLRRAGADTSVIAGESTVGGGSLPGSSLPTPPSR